MRAEPPVALVTGNLDPDDQKKLAEAYLNFLYTPEAQAITFKVFYPGWDMSKADPADVARLPKLDLVTIADFGGWARVRKYSSLTAASWTGSLPGNEITADEQATCPPIRDPRAGPVGRNHPDHVGSGGLDTQWRACHERWQTAWASA